MQTEIQLDPSYEKLEGQCESCGVKYTAKREDCEQKLTGYFVKCSSCQVFIKMGEQVCDQ